MNNTINKKHLTCIIAMFVIGNSIISVGNMNFKYHVLATYALSILFMIPVIFIYSKIFKLCDNKNIFEVNTFCFGKFIGSILNIIYILYFLLIGTLCLRSFSNFVHIVSLPHTLRYIIASFIAIICLYLANSSMRTIGNFSIISYYICVIIFIFCMFSSFNIFDFDYIYPLRTIEIKEILGNSYHLLVFPFAEIIIFLSFSKNIKEKSGKYLFLGIFMGAIILSLNMLHNTLTLGNELTADLFFASFSAFSLIHAGEFIQRIEVFISLIFLLSSLIRIVVCIRACSNGLRNVLKNVKIKKYITFIITFTILVLSQIVMKNSLELFDFVSTYIRYAPIIQIVIPTLILITLFFKNRYITIFQNVTKF